MAEPFLDLISHLQQNFKVNTYLGVEGTLDGSTYDPKSGTVQLVVGEGYTDCYNPSVTPYAVVGTLLTDGVGNQRGPLGGERAVAVPTRGGWRISVTHGEDDNGVSDAPGAPGGEHWTLHPKAGTVGAENDSPPTWDSGWKLTNDGPTANDGLGGAHFGYQGALTNLNTASGHVVSLNDTAKTVSTTTAGGMTDVFADTPKTITRSPGLSTLFEVLNATNQTITHQSNTNIFTLIDGANSLINHQAGTGNNLIIDEAGSLLGHTNSISALVAAGGFVSLGGKPSASGMFNAISTNDITTMLSNSSTGINIQLLQGYRNVTAALLQAMTTSGVPSLPTLAVALTALWGILGISPPSLPGSYAATPVPSGSSIVQVHT